MIDMKLLLFCVESNKQEQIDWLYIESIVKYMFVEDNNIVRRPVFMNSRSRYNSAKVQKEITRYRSTSYESVSVVYCVDTDKYETDTNQKKELENIVKYCATNDYDLVWFCHDIEEVCVGHSVPDSEKKAYATRFVAKEEYKIIDKNKLMNKAYSKGFSNFVTVVSKYLTMKSDEHGTNPKK